MLAISDRPVQLKCDCAAVVQEITDMGQSDSPIAGIAKEIRNLLTTMPAFQVCKVNRFGNCVAHELATPGRNVCSGSALLGSVRPAWWMGSGVIVI